MKKLLLLALMAICTGIIVPCKVYAVDITVGATTWDAWLEEHYKDATYYKSQAIFYGPALSVRFYEDFNLTFIYLSGSFAGNYKRKDSDLALNYRLSDYFKLFAGVKYMEYLKNYTVDDILSPPPGIADVFVEHKGIGPGLGLTATLPVTENVYILATLSGFYLWGKEKTEIAYATPEEKKSKYNDYGINSTISFAYYITPASTTISFGKRFQYYKTAYKDKDYRDPGHKDKLNGITLTATYNFGI